VTPAPRHTLPGQRRSGTGPGSFGKPRREAVEIERASARCRSRAQLIVLCYAPHSEHEMLAARRPTRAAHGDGRCPSDLRPRLRRIPNTSCSVRHDPWCTATARSWTDNTPARGAPQGQTCACVAQQCLPTRPIWTLCARCRGGRTCTTNPVGRRRAERAQRERRGSDRGRGR